MKMTNTVLKPAWAGATLRLDPSRFPQQVTYALRGALGDVTITIDERGAVLRKILPGSGLPLSFALPARAFKGVAARAMENGDGEVTVTLELHHHDPKCTVPLLVASDLYDVAADWRGWADLFGLPMLMVEADGTIQSLEETLGKIKAAAPAPRRRSPNRQRRPRFLARRKPGLGIRMIVSGEEIIARH